MSLSVNTKIATGGGSASPNVNYEVLPEVIKGKSDWRKYKALRLSNGVQVLLVEDKETTTHTAMSVCVNAGASYDPKEFPGLAHFTEHMCFLGSEKYPGENEYKRYLSAHGGRSNASTSMAMTTYKFDVLAEHALKAVDIFSQFFVAPLFTISGTEREVNAVDSENSKNLISDVRRRLQILKALADPDHHYSKFSTGNAQTLAAIGGSSENIDKGVVSSMVRELLLAFHRRHYRPENMSCVIVGPQSLKTLEQWIVPRFSAIPNRWKRSSNTSHADATYKHMVEVVESMVDTAAKDVPLGNLFQEEFPPYNPAFKPEIQQMKWPVLLTTNPLKNVRKLVLLFPIPTVMKNADRNPNNFASHLLGHEGEGSVFAALQDEGLITSLGSGVRMSACDQSLHQIEIALTEEGEIRWEEVVETVFAYYRLLRNKVDTAIKAQSSKEKNIHLEDLQRIWGEQIALARIHFDYTLPGDPYAFAPKMSQNILINGPEKCLSNGRMLDESEYSFPLDELAEFMEFLTPQNCIIERCSKVAWDNLTSLQVKGETEKVEDPIWGFQKEKWYNIDYHLTALDKKVIQPWISDIVESSAPVNRLRLPNANEFIPKNLELCPELPEEAKAGPRIEADVTPPSLVVNNKRFRLWHKLDDRYALPKASLTILIRSKNIQHEQSASGKWIYSQNAMLTSQLIKKTFNSFQKQATYDALLAGISWSLSDSSYGLTLNCSGYSDNLSHLALKLLRDFYDDESAQSFLQSKYFDPVKEKRVRTLKSFKHSSRSDTLASYYKNLLLSGQSTGVEHSIELIQKITLESLIQLHKSLLAENAGVECLYAGNISETNAVEFFKKACAIIDNGTLVLPEKDCSNDFNVDKTWVPGPFERRLAPGEDINLYFQSDNNNDENGVVVMKFQSDIPGFKGLYDDPASLKRTAALRLLCHMIKEPCFNELRTQQQLGYIVGSYYDSGIGMLRDGGDTAENYVPESHTAEYIGFKVLSKKLSPEELTKRMDNFLVSFQNTIKMMPESEIRSHTASLGKKLRKPYQSLGDETSVQFFKIKRLAPEVLAKGGSPNEIPWRNAFALAEAVEGIARDDILDVYQSIIMNPQKRSRVVTHVYGTTFQRTVERLQNISNSNKDFLCASQRQVLTFQDLLSIRSQLKPFDITSTNKTSGLIGFVQKYKQVIDKSKIAKPFLTGLSLLGLTFLLNKHFEFFSGKIKNHRIEDSKSASGKSQE